MTALAPHVAAFLRERLPLERGASVHTCDNYAYALKLLVLFAAQKLKVRPSELEVEHLDARLVSPFLADLESRRKNEASTRNTRLAAIKSFMRFLEYRLPSALEQIRQVLAIPFKKTTSRLVAYLTQDEMHAVLGAPDPTTRYGIRDRAMLYLGFTAGLRVSEIVGLRVEDLSFRPRPAILVRGKGRRERTLVLWKRDRRSPPCLAGSARRSICPRGLLQRPWRGDDPSGLRLLARQVRLDCRSQAAVAQRKAGLAARPPPHLRRHRPPRNS